MSSLHRTIEGDVVVHHLAGNDSLVDRSLLAKHGRSSRTLAKSGPLRLTIVALGAGGELAQHRAPGPVTMHVLEGDISFAAAGNQYSAKAGDVLVMASGVEHSASSREGGTFLLTVVDLGAGASASPGETK
jgi:quercetin dioxygenase-like cupin family protein